PTIEGHFAVFFLNTAIKDTTNAATSTAIPIPKVTAVGMHARMVPTTASPRPTKPSTGVAFGPAARGAAPGGAYAPAAAGAPVAAAEPDSCDVPPASAAA